MDLFQLKCFVNVVDQRSFTKAAFEVSSSQSALSKQISKLEDELNLSLIHIYPLLVVDGQCGDDAVLYLRADDPGMEEQLHAHLVHQIEDQIFEYLGLIGDDWDIQVSASA